MNTDSPGALSSSSQPDHPASPVRVEPVVIVLVQLAQRRFLVTGIELDDPDPAEIAAHVLDVTGQARRQGSVRRPDAVLVCLAVVPGTPAVHLAGSRRERREVGVAATLPVNVGQ